MGVGPTHCIRRDPSGIPPDLVYGPGGPELVPAPPFTFVQEHLTGSQPCVGVRDARGRLWRAKWGDGARPETFAVRFAHACGYFAEVTHFVSSGTIDGATRLARAAHYVDSKGRFVDARFELEDLRGAALGVLLRVATDIAVDHVRWLCPYLGRLTEMRLRDGLVVSGATPDDAALFSRALLDRIAQLQAI